jgi:ferredoxin
VLCGGCADVCPTLCLKLVSLADIATTDELREAYAVALGEVAEDLSLHSAILKDEDRCIRCAACAMRCPSDAITMERVSYRITWRNV